MPSKIDRKCLSCSTLIARASITGLCARCYYAKRDTEAKRTKRDIKCRLCPTMIRRDNTTGLCAACFKAERHAAIPSERVLADRERKAMQLEAASIRHKYDESLRTIERQNREIKALGALGEGLATFKIEPQLKDGTSEATVVIPASDWHVEERVDPGTVSGLNEYTEEIARGRVQRFFQGGLRLTQLLQQDVAINTAILALLGDFISNDIHEEFPELNKLQPTHAVIAAQNMIVSGIEFWLNHSKLNLVIPCHSGNHARTTRTTRFGAESGHSLEYLMYLHLATYFKNEHRVRFIVPEGYHSYIEVYGQTLRFHHGHAIKYQGGIGGVFIPAFKAISQWNKARHADLDVFGHFHQLKDGGNFVSNGSVIGYNAFALSIKADYEPPKQALILIDKKRGRTCTWPILVK